MKKFLIPIAALGLVAWQGFAWAGDAAEMSGVCMDCHELDEFKGKDAAAMTEAFHTANAENKMMAKATADMSPEDIKAVIDYIAAEANK